MSYLCAWFFILLSIICLLSYACGKVIKNIQLWAKVCKILIHPPFLVLSISNNWYQSSVIQKRLNILNKIPMDMEKLKKNLEEALETIDLLIEERDNLKDRYEDAKAYIGELKDKIDDLKKKEPSEKTNNDDIEDLEKENEILKH